MVMLTECCYMSEILLLRRKTPTQTNKVNKDLIILDMMLDTGLKF